MKKARLILTASMLTIAGFSAVTLSSCSKDDAVCPVGYQGSDCKTEVRTQYYNSYRGTGSDNSGGTYTNWALKFSALGSDATKMQLQIVDNNNAPQLLFNVALNTNTTYTVEPKTDGAFSYTGNGSINTTNASLTLTEKDNTTGTIVTTVYTFANMNKE